MPIVDGEVGEGLPFVLHTEYEDASVVPKPESFCVIENSGKGTHCGSGENGGSGEDEADEGKRDSRSLGEKQDLDQNEAQVSTRKL